MIYKGSCHCGKIDYQIEGELDQVIECNCSICSRRGYLLWFVPRTQLTLSTPETSLPNYTFNKHKIKHYFCADCGCAPFGMSKDNKGIETVAVNVRCLENVDVASLNIKPFDGRAL